MIPMVLAATALKDLLSIYVLEGILIFGLLYLSGFIINSLTDVEVDRRYKSYISDGVAVLGRRVVIGLLLAHLLIQFHSPATRQVNQFETELFADIGGFHYRPLYLLVLLETHIACY